MAKQGRIYLFGDGTTKVNPIHGADLAEVCVDALFRTEKKIEVGGKEILTHKEIAKIAFESINKKSKITYVPDWVRRFLLWMASIFMGKANYGTTEFFLNVMAMDMATNQYGRHSIKAFFTQLKKVSSVNTCLRCHSSELFKEPFELTKPLNMRESCSVCHQYFEPETGFCFLNQEKCCHPKQK